MGFIFDWIEIHAVDHCNNACRGCNNHSPFAPKKEYRAEEYIPWLGTMLERKMDFKTISILGGEPFLHSDLHGFIGRLKDNFDQKIALSTNIFWLSERNIERFEGIFNMVDLLNVTIYPPLQKRFGGTEEIDSLLDTLRARYPEMDLVVRRATSFYRLEFTDEPMDVDHYCGAADCTCLLADGRLARCGPGAYAHLSPEVTRTFLDNCQDMFYDLKSDTGDFWMWRRRWPLEACRYCTHFTRQGIPWRSLRARDGADEGE